MTVQVGLDTTYGYLSETGIGRYVRSLSEALREVDGVSTTELTASSSPARSRSLRLAQGLRREAAWYPLLLARRARSAGCTVLHVPHPTVVGAGRLPLVVSVHDLQPLVDPSLFTRWPRAQLRASIPALRRAARLIAPSDATRTMLIERLGIPAERVVVAHLGVSPEFAPVDPAAALTRLGIERPYLLCVGALEPRKNLGAVLRAFDLVARAEPDCELVIAGPSGWRNDEFEELLPRSPGRIRMTGYVSDAELTALYSGAACFAYPSLGEGFGLPVLEAMACGAPVVTSDRTSLPELVADAGLVIDADDVEELADAILEVLSNDRLRTTLGERSRRRAAEFTWERCAATTADVYREVAAP